MKQSEEVLDTWFSSALWPFAVLGWPQECKEFSEGKCLKAKGDLKRFYPADIMTSAPEILHLWITRMIFSGMEFMGREPFRNVYIHPVVLTKEGKRMSKSLGTGIDPLELIEKYGADATRFGLLWLTGSNQALRFNEDTIIMAQKFANKVWNAARFILINDPPQLPAEFRDQLSAEQLTAQDKTILDLLRKTTSAVNGHLAHFRFDRASEALYNFFWHDFCDVYIEAAKEQIYGAKGTKKAQRTQQILLYVLLNSLKLLHPFMPFITEEIYQNLPLKDKKKFLMIEQWPN
jgi:valyl-tRNA synthetase